MGQAGSDGALQGARDRSADSRRSLGELKDAGTVNYAQVSMARRNNFRVALEGARLAREMHGGNGVTTEYSVIRHTLNLETVDP